jgi:hypothetical protein
MRDNIDSIRNGMNEKIVIIDPKNEYEKLAELSGAKVITLDPNNFSFFNPFEIGLEKVMNEELENNESVIENLKELLLLHYEWVDIMKGDGKEITFKELRDIFNDNQFKISDEELLNLIKECKDKIKNKINEGL